MRSALAAPILPDVGRAAPRRSRHGTELRIKTVTALNLDFTEWDQAFPANRLLASATLDRLRHNAYCLVLDGHSYRAPKLAPAATKSKVANNSKSTHS
jgi:hypothetical protein